ncbi:uncharacterized protein LOC127281168 [Leptopilina boulardi]|uniref:uncharacterized protein LOC127281168 n=1 Tax=Leptopilina boulardi TaxID=63433 RepID=UPI0021F57B5D|nr:uncharacterized protein LOC127281168 [Leptopilina boulardi]
MSDIFINQYEWKARALEFQTNLASGPLASATWDRFEIKTSEKQKYLYDKIKISLFGNMEKLTNEQNELINLIKEKCIDKSCYSNSVHLGIIYVSILFQNKSEFIFPIFRIRSNEDNDLKSTFIDHLSRVYNNFQAYLETNTWDLSFIVIPVNGIYKLIDEKCDILFSNQSERGLLKATADDTAKVVGIGSTVGMIAGMGLSLFPLTMPVGIAVLSTSGSFGVASGIYGAGRAISTLQDRKEHELSISFTDKEARGCWITIASSSLSFISMGAQELIAPKLIQNAQLGHKCSLLLTSTYTTISVASLSLNAIGFVNLIYDVAIKDNVTNEDILNLITTTFFFFHSAMNFQTASNVIKKAQKMELAKLKEPLTPEQQEIFDTLREAHWENVDIGNVDQQEGDRRYIRELKTIDNIEQFFQQFNLTSDGQLKINGELTIHQRAFIQIPQQERLQILQELQKLNQNQITIDEFRLKTENTRRNYSLTLDRERCQFKDNITNVYGENFESIQINGENIFQNIKPHEIDRLHQVTKHSLNNDHDYVKLGKEFSNEMKVKNITEYCASSEYAARQVQKEISNRIKTNSNPTRPHGVKAKDFYKTQIINEMRDNNFQQIKESFVNLKNQCDSVNQRVLNTFGNSYAAANHYDKHQILPSVNDKNALTPAQYFDIASDMVSQIYCEIEWTQDGSSLKCTFKNDQLMAIKFENVTHGESVIATLMDTKKNTPIAQKYCYYPKNSIGAYYVDFHDVPGFSE